MMQRQMTAKVAASGARVARRLFLDRQAAFWRRQLWDERARVLEVVVETADARTFVLRPPAGWRRHRAGQYTLVDVEIGGVRVRRCYSISSAPGDRAVAVTVKRVPGGQVSNWLHDHVRVGDALAIGPAAGDFVLPETGPAPLLFLSGGSGITPIMSMLRDLARRSALSDVIVVHYARSRADVIFDAALAQLAAAHPGLRLHLVLDDAPGGGFDEGRLARLVPDFAARSTFLCGPPGLMARVEAMWQGAGAVERLRRERFVMAAPRPGSDGAVRVRLTESDRSLELGTAGTLLAQLEQAGVRPQYGCRVGICHTCTRRKRSGTVENVVTGAISREAEEIQLCVSAPRSDLELEL